jgi:hypothetical protein
MSQTMGLTRSGKVGGAGSGGKGARWLAEARRSEWEVRDSGKWGGMVMEAPNFVRIFQPKSGAGQDGIIRKEGTNSIPPAKQGSGRVLYGQKGEPSIPMIETDEGTVKPEWAGSTEQVAPVSKRKEMDLPATWSVTLGLARVIGIPESWCHQSSASPRKSGIWMSGGADPP